MLLSQGTRGVSPRIVLFYVAAKMVLLAVASIAFGVWVSDINMPLAIVWSVASSLAMILVAVAVIYFTNRHLHLA